MDQQQQAETEAAAPKKKPAPKKHKKKAASKAVSTVVKPPPPPAERNFLQVVAEATLNPACDVGKMQALLDMQERIEDRDAKKAWTRDFNTMQGELPAIDKDGKIDHGDGVTARGNQKLKTSFATFPNLNAVCKPIMKKHGFTLSSFIEPAADGLRINVVSILEHIGGKDRTSRFPMSADATGGKNNQQGWGSSQQYGMRYNMIALLQIVTKAKQDIDNDGFPQQEDPSPITAQQLDALVKLADEAGADKAKFCELMKVSALASIPASRYAEAVAQLNRKLKAKQKKAAADFPGDR
jgi:hypothetical protein